MSEPPPHRRDDEDTDDENDRTPRPFFGHDLDRDIVWSGADRVPVCVIGRDGDRQRVRTGTASSATVN